MNSSIQVSIYTPWNKRRGLKGQTRVLRDGRWVRKDPVADNVLAWLKTGQELTAVNRVRV